MVYWEEVEPAVAQAVRARVEEFQEAGISGVDLYLASFGPALEEYDEALEHLIQDDPREYSEREIIERLNALERQAIEEIDRLTRKADLIEFEQMESGYRIHHELIGRKPRRKGMFMDRMFG